MGRRTHVPSFGPSVIGIDPGVNGVKHVESDQGSRCCFCGGGVGFECARSARQLWLSWTRVCDRTLQRSIADRTTLQAAVHGLFGTRLPGASARKLNYGQSDVQNDRLVRPVNFVGVNPIKFGDLLRKHIRQKRPAQGSVILFEPSTLQRRGFQHNRIAVSGRQISRLLSKALWDGVTWRLSRVTPAGRSCGRGWRAPIGAL
jgi:hypothetical protein